MTIPFDPPRHRFGRVLVGLARRWRRRLDEALARGGFPDASWVPLVHLADHGDGICQRDLAARVGLDGSSLVRLLDALAARGHVERRPKPGDRRMNLVHLTDAGRRAVDDLQVILRACEAEMTADLDEADLALALDVFDRIVTDPDGPAEARS